MLLGVVVTLGGQKMNSKDYEVYVGLDVHKDTISVATAAAHAHPIQFFPAHLQFLFYFHVSS